MVDQQYILSVEELGFSLACAGYDGMAMGLLKEAIGDVSEEGLALIFQTASRSLYTKGILLELNEEHPEKAFIPEFKELLDELAGTEKMLRCFNETEYGQFILTAHHGSKGFVYHLVSNGIVHILNYIKKDGLMEELKTFFHPALTAIHERLSFSCSDAQFQQLLAYLQGTDRDVREHSIEVDSFSNTGAVEEFCRDYLEVEGNLVNISVISTVEEELPAFDEVVMLLIGQERAWSIRNVNPNKDEEAKLKIQTLTDGDWFELIHSFIDSIK